MNAKQTALIRELQIDKMLNDLTIEQRFQLIYDLTFIDESSDDIDRLRDFLSDSKKELKAIQKAVYMNEKNISSDAANWDTLVIEDAIRIFKKTC